MKLKVNKYTYLIKCLRTLVVVILLYLYVYNPPFSFLPISCVKILSLVFFPIFLIHRRIRNSFFTLFGEKSKLILLFILFLFYSFAIKFIHSSEAIYAQSNLFLFVESFIIAYIISIYLIKRYEEKADKIILWTSIIASLITFYLICNPEINQYVRTSLLVLEKDSIEFMSFRCFGVADSLLFTYPIALGISACVCLKYSFQNPIYYLFLFLLLVAIFLNARIGIVPFGLYIVYIVFVEHKVRVFLKSAICILLFIIILLNLEIASDYEKTIEWVIDGFIEISNLLSGKENEKVGNTDVLANMIIIPQTISSFIWGTGKDVYTAYKNSDIGYIIQLNYGGILYVILIIAIVFCLVLNLMKSNKMNKWYNFVFIATILLCNVKGYFFITNSGTRILMLLYFIYLFQNGKCKVKN